VRRRLYKLGAAEQWIKEGENAIKWTRLSWRTFAANAVRLQPHALQRHASVRAKERDLALRFREPLAFDRFCLWRGDLSLAKSVEGAIRARNRRPLANAR